MVPARTIGEGHRGTLRLAVVVEADAVQRRIGQPLDHLTRRQEGRHPGRMPVYAVRQSVNLRDLRLEEVDEIPRLNRRRNVAVEDHGDGDRRWR